MKKLQIFIPLLFTISAVLGQENIKYYKFHTEIEESVRNQIFTALDSLFVQLTNGELNEEYLSPKLKDLTFSVLSDIQKYEQGKDSTQKSKIDKHLIRGYPIEKNKFFLSIAFIRDDKEKSPVIYYILNLLANRKNDKIYFSSPLLYFTRNWKQTKVGKITYHHTEKLNLDRAKIFDKKNALIAKKIGVQSETFDFYMCENYQEILRLLGIEYSVYENSKYRTGYGVDANTIFSIMNHEDFSHDIFHYYSGKINKRENRNWITEEGIAYLWGNAYYTDSNGEMISHQQLVGELENYLLENPNESLFDLFENNTKIFNHIAPEISVRSTISGIIANQVENEKGMEGISKLINAGSKDRLESYLNKVNELIGIDKNNFNIKVKKLITKN